MPGEYANLTAGLGHVADYVALTGGMAQSNTVDLARDIKGVNVSVAGNLKITTARGTTITIHVPQGDVGLPPTRKVWVTGTTASLTAGII